MGARILIIDDSPTIRKVVGMILAKYNYEPVTASDGKAALELLETQSFDLILLDFVMPRMNGYQFCRELRAHEQFKKLPVVLMSAKAEKIRDQFLQQTGAIDAITKPFDPKGLVAVVEGALEKAQSGRVPTGPEPEQMADEDSLDVSLDGLRPSYPPDLIDALETTVRTNLSHQLASRLKPIMENVLGTKPTEAGQVEKAIAEMLGPETLNVLASCLRHYGWSGTKQEILSGDLASIPLGEILQVLQMQRQTGLLDITNGQVRISISLRDGLVDLAQAHNASAEFRLGRYFREEGLVDGGVIEQVVTEAAQPKSLIGVALVHRGVVTDDDLRRALTRQTSEIIYDVFRWPRGRFALLRDANPPEADAARLGLSVAAIVMEGFRRVDEWRLIEESMNFDESLVRNETAIGTLKPDELTRQEKNVLDAVDGQRSVREVIDQTHQSSFDTCKALYRLLQSRLVRRQAT